MSASERRISSSYRHQRTEPEKVGDRQTIIAQMKAASRVMGGIISSMLKPETGIALIDLSRGSGSSFDLFIKILKCFSLFLVGVDAMLASFGFCGGGVRGYG